MSQVFTCNFCNLVCHSRGGLTRHRHFCQNLRYLEKLEAKQRHEKDKEEYARKFAQQQVEEFAKKASERQNELQINKIAHRLEQLCQDVVQINENIIQTNTNTIQGMSEIGQGVSLLNENVVQGMSEIGQGVGQINETLGRLWTIVCEKNKILDNIQDALDKRNFDLLTPESSNMLELLIDQENNLSSAFKEEEYQFLTENAERVQPLCQRICDIRQQIKDKNVRVKVEHMEELQKKLDERRLQSNYDS